MIDEKTKDVIDLLDIREEMIKVMLTKATDNKITNTEIKKFCRYFNLKLKNNNSKNNLENRIASLYRAIQKLYKEFSNINNAISK